MPVTRIENFSPAVRWETNRREEKAEEKRRQKRREYRREEREGVSEGMDGSRTSPALAKKPAGIVDSGAPESDT